MNPRHGWTDYHQRMGRVVAYLHEHLEQPLDLARVAEVAHLSPYHWHRVYHALTGETLAATLKRLRLHRASGYLANTRLPIDTVARRCGYPNSQSFARAFRGAYGMAPSHYRATGEHVVFRAGVTSPLAQGYAVELREVPVLQLAGLAHHGPYMRIGKAFEMAHAALAGQGLHRPGTRWVAEYLDDPFLLPEAQLRSRAGLSLPAGAAFEAPLQAFSVGGGRCAVLRHQGPYATMHAAYQWLYGHWLVESGHTPADQPVFEEYLNNPRDVAPAELLTDIFLPLAAAPTGE